MKKNLPVASLILLSSCRLEKPIAAAPPENNLTYKVEYLFEHDGCKVYRFHDRGTYVYFTNCRGEAIAMPDSLTIKNSTAVRATGHDVP